MTTGQADRMVVLTASQKTVYHRTGRDICPWCKKPVYEGQLARIKYSGSRHRVYHELCYCQRVIEL